MRGLEAFFLLLTQKAETQTHTASQSARARARARTHLAHLALAPCRRRGRRAPEPCAKPALHFHFPCCSAQHWHCLACGLRLPRVVFVYAHNT